MSVFTPDVTLESPNPLPIDGGNPNPVLITGAVSLTGSTDGLALDASIQTLITDLTNGTAHIIVDNFPASQAVTGTFWQATQPVSIALPVSVTQGTSPWVVSGTITTSPNVNVHDGAGNTIASTGTSLNVDVTNTVPVTGTFWQATQPVSLASTTITGTVAVTQSTSPWVVSGTVTANLGTIGGAATAANQATIITDLGTVISNQTNGTQHTVVDNFPADADALAQGSTTSGQLGALVMGAVTTSAPTYTTATTNPLSIDTAGNLRVTTTPSAALTSTVVQITSNSANQVLLVANPSRKKAILFFSTGIWAIKLGTGATTTSFTYMSTSSNTTIEVTPWAGEIDAICTTSGKLVNVTEVY